MAPHRPLLTLGALALLTLLGAAAAHADVVATASGESRVIAAAPAPAQADAAEPVMATRDPDTRLISLADITGWANWFYAEAARIALGPRPGPVAEVAETDCGALYAKRVAMYREDVHGNPSFSDDPRNRAATFLGSIFKPAYLFLAFSAFMEFRDNAVRLEKVAELDNLRMASAREDCFVR